jgi:hypothetical protein
MSDPFQNGKFNPQRIATDRDYSQFFKRKATKLTFLGFLLLTYLTAPVLIFLSGQPVLAGVLVAIPVVLMTLFWLLAKALDAQ